MKKEKREKDDEIGNACIFVQCMYMYKLKTAMERSQCMGRRTD